MDEKNNLITSSRVAIIDIKKDTESKNPKESIKSSGITAFSLPKKSHQNYNLHGCTVGSADEKEKTILLVSNKYGGYATLLCVIHYVVIENERKYISKALTLPYRIIRELLLDNQSLKSKSREIQCTKMC